MHHPPFATGFRTDNSRMREAEAFLSILSDSGSVRHLFVGHMHRAASGNWRGYSWSSLHGTCYENAFMMLPLQPDILSGPSQIGVAMLDQGDVVLHFHDIQEPYEVVGVRK
jgi:3',5'-cyclic AMP phosphodiesterase CpdA